MSSDRGVHTGSPSARQRSLRAMSLTAAGTQALPSTTTSHSPRQEAPLRTHRYASRQIANPLDQSAHYSSPGREAQRTHTLAVPLLESPSHPPNTLSLSGSNRISSSEPIMAVASHEPYSNAAGYRPEGILDPMVPVDRVSNTQDVTEVNVLSTTTRSPAGKWYGFWYDAWYTLLLGGTYTCADIRRRPRNLLVGVLAVLLLVFFTGVSISGMMKTPYILLRLAELTSGEMDVVLFGGGSIPLINFTNMHDRLMRSTEVHGCVPRWLFQGSIQSDEATFRRNGDDAAFYEAPFSRVNVLVADTLLEREAGVGRAWPYRPIGYAESQIFHSAADFIGVSPNRGERVRFSLDMNLRPPPFTAGLKQRKLAMSPLSSVMNAKSFYHDDSQVNDTRTSAYRLDPSLALGLSVTMADGIAEPFGKYPSVLGNVMLLDYKQIVQAIYDQSCLDPQLPMPSLFGFPSPVFPNLRKTPDIIAQLNLSDYSMLVATIWKRRYDAYYADTDQRDKVVTQKGNSMMLAVGLDFEGNVQYPIALSISTFDNFKVLLSAAFIALMIGVVILCGILLFTLLQLNAEERQYELAMLRVQGMRCRRLVVVLVFQALTLIVPGVVMGVGLIFAVNAILEVVLSRFTKAPAHLLNPPLAACLVSASLGFVLPIIAAAGPISRALEISLHNALDVYRQGHLDIRIVMVKLEEIGLSTWQVLFGTFLVLAGFIVYYMMPLSFILNNLMLFFVLLDLVLLCLVGGLCMMVYVLQPFAEVCVVFLLLWGKEKRLHQLVTKNLHRHRSRNVKAFMMFVMSIACVIASGILLTMLSQISTQLIQITNGADVIVKSGEFGIPLDQQRLDNFFNGQGKDYVNSWAYSSFPLNAYPHILGRTSVASAVGASSNLDVIAVSDTFFDATFSSFNMVYRYDKRYPYPRDEHGHRDIVRSMYATPPHSVGGGQGITGVVTGIPENFPEPNLSAKSTFVVPFMIASSSEELLGITVGSTGILKYTYALESRMNTGTVFILEPRALMKRVSGFFSISSLPITGGSAILIPDTYFSRLLNPVDMDFINSTDVSVSSGAVTEVRQRVLYIRLRSGLSNKERATLVNALQVHVVSGVHEITDTQTLADQFKSIEKVILLFFYAIASICVILCAFMLWVTFAANVQLNLWTYGVLRSVGFSMGQLVRSAVYESLAIVLSAFIIGCVNGLIAGLAVALQLSVFLAVPLQFPVPYLVILIMLSLALLAAVLGSYFPILAVKRYSIAAIVKTI